LSYKRRYSQQYTPPAPTVNITVYHPTDSTQSTDVEALVDSGADYSMIPRGVVELLGLVPFDVWKSGDFDGNDTGDKAVYHVKISIGSFDFDTTMVETNGDTLIGRNDLNNITTVLKGRKQELELQKP